MKKEVIYVGLSGGVDSSVAALRLKKQGHTVVGVFIKTWQPDFLNCNWEAERLDAMRVAAHLDIPFLTFDAEEAYKTKVADYMIREYTEGRTPNPDVMCNQYVKFGVFLDWALAHGADKVATGHYARMEARDGYHALLRGVDEGKDQSYFLWTLTEEQRMHSIFPIGDTAKADIRKEAEDAGLLTSKKADSQGICFLGHVDIKEFLAHYVTTEAGDVLDEAGTVVGVHDGALFYTYGQRHGFTLKTEGVASKPHYVVDKDIVANTITVATTPRSAVGETVTLTHRNAIRPTWPQEMDAQFRYRQTPLRVTYAQTDTEHGILTVLTDVEQPSEGQSCVLYDGDECLGGGIITAG
ncbi:MAG: tRNA 2-thiouridine(34) synthase MnmA [Candidatus Pacebacteria bacterium]|nr:tRNA 2-thiouridine(34) synthase MnmA [Candidatus Paceibacterota bacterium]